MALVIKMPKFGLTMTEGVVTHWCKSVGDSVKAGEPLYEVQTDKITNELEAQQDGILRYVFVPAGTTVEVGAPIAIIAGESEDIQAIVGSGNKTAESEAFVEEERITVEPGTTGQDETTAFTKATPLARKLGRERGIAIKQIQGSGPGGIIVSRDVEDHHSEAPSISPLAKKWAEENDVDWDQIDQRTRIMLPDVIAAKLRSSGEQPIEATNTNKSPMITAMKGMRKVIAERMSKSWQEIPHVTITREVDVTSLVAAISMLQADSERTGVKITLTHFFLKIVATALRQHPALNAWCNGTDVTYHPQVHLGVAVAVPDGLYVPVIDHACEKDLGELAQSLTDITTRAREHRLNVDEMCGGTFTISNLGMMGVDGFTPIINPPETGILGIGAVTEKPVILNGQIETRSMITLSLSFDHRALDGAQAAHFLQTIYYYAQEPLRLLVKERT